MRKIFIITFIILPILMLVDLTTVTPVQARYSYQGSGGKTWYPTRSFTGNYYGSGGLWGSYGGGYLYGPGNYGGYWWKSPTGRWWVSPR